MADRAPFPFPAFQEPGELEGVLGADGRTWYREVDVAVVVGFRPVSIDLVVPAAAPGAGPVPVVVLVHGGAFLLGSRRAGPLVGPAREALLARGIAVAAVEYRLSGEAPFPACLHDVKAAVRWLRRFGADLGLRADAIGAWGESAGAHLVAFLALGSSGEALDGTVGVTGVSSDVRAAVAWYPPTQFATMDAQAPADAVMSHDAADSPESLLIGGAVQDHLPAATLASPVAHVTAAAVPLLLVHGLRDRVVPHQQSVVLHGALVRAGVAAQLVLVPGADHVFAGVPLEPLVEAAADHLAGALR